MKNTFYLYELEKWTDKYYSVSSYCSCDYIIMHIARLQELLESESHIASDKYALEHDTCPKGAYDKIVKDRKDAIEFWQNKLEEL